MTKPNPTPDPAVLRRRYDELVLACGKPLYASDMEILSDVGLKRVAEILNALPALLDAVEERDALRGRVAELEGEVLAATHTAEDFGEAWREAQSERDALRDALRIERDNLAGTIGWIRKRVDAKDGEATEHAVEQLYRERDAARDEVEARDAYAKCCEQERDAARGELGALEQEHAALCARTADLERRLRGE